MQAILKTPWLDPPCPEMPSASKMQHSKTWVSPLPFFQGDSSPNVCGSGDVPHRVSVLIGVMGSLCMSSNYLKVSVPCGSLLPQLPPSLPQSRTRTHPCTGRDCRGGPHSLACCAGCFFTFNFFGKLYPLGICQRFLLLFNTFKIQNFADKLDHRLCLVKRCG